MAYETGETKKDMHMAFENIGLCNLLGQLYQIEPLHQTMLLMIKFI